MARIVTITVNPAVDLATSVERVAPIHKLRCHGLRRDPGGGGINVARVVRRMGSPVTAIYTAGGSIGGLLQSLVAQEQVDSVVVPVSAETREDFTVHEQASGQQFRFVLAGPRLEGAEWRACLDAIRILDPFPDYVVASGSLPPGVPTDFYGQVATLVRERAARLVLDTSDGPLREALAQGVFLVKPNLSELCELVTQRLETEAELVDACRKIVDEGQAEVVALSLGHRGALLVSRERAWRAPALPIEPVSVVGAGDSFVGAMTWSLSRGDSLEVAFGYAMAASAAALLSPGTELCHPEDVHRLYSSVKVARARQDP